MTHVSRLRAAALVVSLSVSLTVGLAGVGTPAGAEPAARQAAEPRLEVGPTTFTEPGPYGVGERTLKLKDGIRVELWYPARRAFVAGQPIDDYDVVDWLPEILKVGLPEGAEVTYPSGGVRGVPVARKKFPLVVFSHGFAGFRTQSSFLTAWLASWGFVVAAPDHPSRNLTAALPGGVMGTTKDFHDLRRTITLIEDRSKAKRSWLRGRVDLTRIGAVGHSAGGRAVTQLAAKDARVDTFVGMAGAGAGALDDGTSVPKQPGMLITGADDAIVTLDRMEAAYAAMNGPKRFVLLQDSGHLVFSDLCEVGASDGGLLAIGKLLGVEIPERLYPLATDGCLDPAMPVTEAWPAVRQTITAYLRHQLGVDRTQAGLSGLTEAFPGIVSDSRSAR